MGCILLVFKPAVPPAAPGSPLQLGWHRSPSSSPGQCPPAVPSPHSRASGAEGSPDTAPTAPLGPAAQQLPRPPAPAMGGFMLRPLAGWLVAPCAAAAGRGAPSTCAPGERGVLRRHGAHGKAKPWSCVQKLWRWPDLQAHRCLAEQILCPLHKYL